MRSEKGTCGVVSPDGKYGCDLIPSVPSTVYFGLAGHQPQTIWDEWLQVPSRYNHWQRGATSCGYCGTWTCVRHGIGSATEAQKGDAMKDYPDGPFGQVKETPC